MQLSAQVQVQFTSKENKSEASIGWWELVRFQGWTFVDIDDKKQHYDIPAEKSWRRCSTDTQRTHRIQGQLLAYDTEIILIFDYI